LPGAELYLLLLLSYPTIYYITFPHPRYRHPIEPELLILIVFLASQIGVKQDRAPRRAEAGNVPEINLPHPP
jgi:hypothetical protein